MIAPVPPIILHVLAVWLFWHSPAAEPYDPPPPAVLSRSARRVFTSENNQVHVGLGGYTDGDETLFTLQVTTGGW